MTMAAAAARSGTGTATGTGTGISAAILFPSGVSPSHPNRRRPPQCTRLKMAAAADPGLRRPAPGSSGLDGQLNFVAARSVRAAAATCLLRTAAGSSALHSHDLLTRRSASTAVVADPGQRFTVAGSAAFHGRREFLYGSREFLYGSREFAAPGGRFTAGGRSLRGPRKFTVPGKRFPTPARSAHDGGAQEFAAARQSAKRRAVPNSSDEAAGSRSSRSISVAEAANEDGAIVRRGEAAATYLNFDFEKARWTGKPLRPGLQLFFQQPFEVFPEMEEAEIIRDLVCRIRESLKCIRGSDGEISVSAYDTAWVARIPHADGSHRPQFPRSLDWIEAQQHDDGSWGDASMPWLYDRIIQTLACIVTLRYWNCCEASVRRGAEFIVRTADLLEKEEILRMPIGFEMSFPALLADAKSLGLDLPFDTPFFGVLEELRRKKLQKVPLHLLHARPTTLLHSLEGIQSLDIDWARILTFRSEDGSICCSPSSTAVLYMRTGDKKCLSFLQNVVRKFNHAVPTCYPLDTFHNLWVVDTLERLGISRHFDAEIKQILEAVYRQWSDEKGICWASVLKDMPDLDDTAMAFRLLRQHGYDVSAEGFKCFQKDKSFACFPVGQMVQGISDMYNLFRAAQVSFPGEGRLVDAEEFSRQFLVDILTKNKGNADKWSLKKDLSGEIEYALRHSGGNNLHRLEVRDYLDKYGPDDAWIGKTIYRLRLVNNPDYLQLAKADFNRCQLLHQMELRQVLTWISNSGVADSSNVRERIVMLYAMFSAEVWEPEFSAVRIAVGKCVFIALVIYQLFLQNVRSSAVQLRKLVEATREWNPSRVFDVPHKFSSCFAVLYNTLSEPSIGATKRNGLLEQLVYLWERLLSSFLTEAEWRASGSVMAFDSSRMIESVTTGLETIALSSIIMSGEVSSPHFVTWMEKDCTFLRSASEAVRLFQRMGFKTPDDGHFSSLNIPKEINYLQGQLTTVPLIVKRVAYSIVKVTNFYYNSSNGAELHSELQQLLWMK